MTVQKKLTTHRSGHAIVGCTYHRMVKLDFDDKTLKHVKFWAKKTCDKFKLQGYMILKSSQECWHVIYNRPVTRLKTLHIIAWTAQQSKDQEMTGYLLFQCINEASTVRISPKGRKKAPRVIFRFGKQDCMIRGYLSLTRSLSSLWLQI